MIKQQRSKIYTRSGDRGETTLISGKKVAKDHLRTNAYGTIDELNSNLGVAISFIKDKKITKILRTIQNELFNIGAQLADPRNLKKTKPKDFKTDTLELESIIDNYDAGLSPLNTFIIPGGTKEAALLHQVRTVCRRAEREVVALAKKEQINPGIISYLNQLSDLLFVLARHLNKKAGRKEVLWKKY